METKNTRGGGGHISCICIGTGTRTINGRVDCGGCREGEKQKKKNRKWNFVCVFDECIKGDWRTKKTKCIQIHWYKIHTTCLEFRSKNFFIETNFYNKFFLNFIFVLNFLMFLFFLGWFCFLLFLSLKLEIFFFRFFCVFFQFKRIKKKKLHRLTDGLDTRRVLRTTK